MKKNKGIKIMALLALFGIIITVIGTGLLIIFDNNNSSNIKQELTPEQLMQFQEMMNSGTLLNEGTGELVGSGNLENK